MTINQIGPNSSAVMENKMQHSKFVDQSHMGAYNRAQSSLISLSQPQQEGFLDGVWSIITWPFTALASLWAWMTGTSEKKDNVDGKEKSSATSDFIDLFKKDKDDDIDNESFREVYSGLNSEDKKNYRTMVWIADGFRTAKTGKDPATKLVEKKTEYKDGEVEVLKDAGEMFKATSKLKSLGDRFAKLADKIIKDVADEDSAEDYDKDVKKLTKELDKLPKYAKGRVDDFAHILEAEVTLFSKKEKDDREMRKLALHLKSISYVLKTCHQSQFLALGTVAARDELERMNRVLEQKGKQGSKVLATEGDIAAEYNGLGSAAKKSFAEAIGYKISKPGCGEQYLLGKLKVDETKIVPDRDMVMSTLKALVKLDGGARSESFES